jgi:hypothetical protein
METTGYFECGGGANRWKYNAEQEYMELRKLKYIEKERKNAYDGCIAKQASRAMSDVNKVINGAAESSHGMIFSLHGRNERNKNTFNPIRKKKRVKTQPSNRNLRPKRTRVALLRMASGGSKRMRVTHGLLHDARKLLVENEREEREEEESTSSSSSSEVDGTEVARGGGGDVINLKNFLGKGRTNIKEVRCNCGVVARVSFQELTINSAAKTYRFQQMF